ncbi:hypothetical protein [Clostridium estertheticum]|uniref:hypothetical protein n=1 Tax=Clostridium estertheticum TaxID=238834 RepID=UPI001C0B98A2|nr:hypothetical protein [Clostridium estertheticum]MBU3173394.1 hypothetical protein [Clostridium estertheticum]
MEVIKILLLIFTTIVFIILLLLLIKGFSLLNDWKIAKFNSWYLKKQEESIKEKIEIPAMYRPEVIETISPRTPVRESYVWNLEMQRWDNK